MMIRGIKQLKSLLLLVLCVFLAEMAEFLPRWKMRSGGDLQAACAGFPVPGISPEQGTVTRGTTSKLPIGLPIGILRVETDE